MNPIKEKIIQHYKAAQQKPVAYNLRMALIQRFVNWVVADVFFDEGFDLRH